MVFSSFPLRGDFFEGRGSNFDGFQFGYNAGWMLGMETDISFPGLMQGLNTLSMPTIGSGTNSDIVEMSGSLTEMVQTAANEVRGKVRLRARRNRAS